MRALVVGTVPLPGLELTVGRLGLEGEELCIGEVRVPVGRGTAAIMAACALTAGHLGLEEVWGATAGDTGRGEGSGVLYRLLGEVGRLSPRVLCLGYVLPNRTLHDAFISALERAPSRPVLIADAGFMYVAKMSGSAPRYDLFAPDLGELAYLADEQAPHPFYTRGFIVHMADRAEELIERAYRTGGAARVMCVKGERDYICAEGEVLEVVEEPLVPELEPIGGTGDTITGMIAALVASGRPPAQAAALAARANRLAGRLARPSPATQIGQIIACLPAALERVLS